MFTSDVFDFPVNSFQRTAPEFPGRLASDDYGNQFQLCLVKGASLAIVAGDPALWYSNDSTGYTVTPDWSQSAFQHSHAEMGMFMGAVPGSLVAGGTGYCWVLRRGNAGLAGVSTIRTDGGVAANEILVASSNDGRWTGIATVAVGSDATTHPTRRGYIAHTRVADTTNSVITAPLMVEINGWNIV